MRLLDKEDEKMRIHDPGFVLPEVYCSLWIRSRQADCECP